MVSGEGGDDCWVVAGLGTTHNQQVVGPDGGSHDVIAIPKVLALEHLDEEDYGPYDGTPHPPGHLDPSVGAKGLGTAGEVRVPPYIWKKYAPAGLSWVAADLPDQGKTRHAGLEALATRMCEDGLLIRGL